MRLHRSAPHTAFLAGLVLLGGCSVAPAAAASEEDDSYLRRHGAHWAVALGAFLLDNKYEDWVGLSTDPLIFSDPPGFDRTVRDRLMRDDPPEPFFLRRPRLAKAVLAAATATLANLGEEGGGRQALDDATGFVELWLLEEGLTGLVKNIAGRQRPGLEHIDEDRSLTPRGRTEEENKEDNRKSFYSGSTSNWFAVASYLDAIAGRRIRNPVARAFVFIGFHGLAARAGILQIQRDRHYLTDVVAGAAVGELLGRKIFSLHHAGGEEDGEGEGPRGIAWIGPGSLILRPSVSLGRDGGMVVLSVFLPPRVPADGG